MKSRVVKAVIGSILFLLLFSAAFAALRPVYLRVNGAIMRSEEALLSKLTENTGLSISYRSLSPSILAGISIKGIEVRDAATGDLLLSAKKAVLSYSLRKILSGDLQDALKKLTVSGASFSLDFDRNAGVLEALGGGSGGGEKTDEPSALLSEHAMQTLSKVLYAFPSDVSLRNIDVSVVHPAIWVRTFVKSLRVRKQDDSSFLSVSGRGTAIAGIPALGGESAGFSYTVSGTLLPELSDSSLLLSVSENPAASYTLTRGEFLARYADRHLNVLSTQRLLPYALTADFDLATSDISLSAQMDAFNPFLLVKVPPVQGVLSDFIGSTVSGTMSLLYNVQSGSLLWDADGSLLLSKKISSAGERISFAAGGEGTTVTVRSLSARGPLASGTLSGTFDMERMQPSGVLVLDYYTLPNGNRVSGELYADPLGEGLSLSIPQLRLGTDQSFSSVQLDLEPSGDSWDFVFSLSDYTHLESDVPGEISAEGTVTPGDYPWVQASVAIDSFFLDSIARAAAFVLDGELRDTVEGLVPTLEPFIMTNELYLSTDLKSVTFNAPYMVVASTGSESPLAALLSFDGNDESVSVTGLQVVFGGNLLEATADVDLSLEERSAVFMADLMLNHIPYSLGGVLTDGKWLSVTGDYGLSVSTSLSAPLSGTAEVDSLPLSLGKYLLSLSLDSSFTYSKNFGFAMDIGRFEAEELGGAIPFMPHLALSGSLTDQSFVITDLSYADSASTMSGDGFVVWSQYDGVFESFTAQLLADGNGTDEHIMLQASLTNPLGAPLSADAVMRDWFFDAQLDVASLLMSRFLQYQSADDTLSATAQASGTLENPFVSLSVPGISAEFNGSPVIANGQFSLEDGTLGISRMNVSWNGIRLSNVVAGIELPSFHGLAQASVSAEFMGKTLTAPLSITVESDDEPYPEGTPLLDMLSLPGNISLSLDSSAIGGTLLKGNPPLHVELNHYKDTDFDMWEFRTDDYFGASGYLYDGGILNVAVEEDKPLHFLLEGELSANTVSFDLANFYLDLSEFAFLINSDVFSVYRGVLTGELSVSGIASDPTIGGAFLLEGFDFNVPSYIADHFTTPRIQLSMFENTLSIPYTEFKVKDTSVRARATLEVDRLSLSSMRADIASSGEKGVPLDIKTDIARVKGRAVLDMGLEYADGTLDVSGDLELNNTTISLMDSSDDDDDDFYGTSSNRKSQEKEPQEGGGEPGLPFAVAAEIHFVVGEKVRLELNPLLRSLVAPDNAIDISLDTSNGTWAVKGDVALRGGEVSWLNRNFYLKEGAVSLNETQALMDPLVTVRAETRERDSDGDSVTISLEASRQRLSQFSPRLYATPAKSESELYQLLGQVAIADSSNVSSLLLSTVDYGVQVTVVRKIEDALRDLLNFDIFSIRTSLLQNAVREGLDSSASSSRNRYSVGNYFDNSTVYIGKYFGTSLYADAMLHWTYDESKETGGNAGGIVFQPEIGLEMEAPFANIRWNFAPDLENFAETVVSSASVTLSWRFTF